MPNEADQPGPMDGLDPIEEQKTRLWALSFEPSRQVVHCQNCGAATVVSRLVANTDAVPERQGRDQASIEYQTPIIFSRPEKDHEKAMIATSAKAADAAMPPALRSSVSRDKRAVQVLSALSATLCLALVTVLVRSRPR